MECVRGFCFMPETKVQAMDLQFIEGGELERTWKTTRRQRRKEQEQKIWNEFVKEQDVVKTLCNDDPYQFLEQLPEPILKELMEIELHKMRKEKEELDENEQVRQGDDDNTLCDQEIQQIDEEHEEDEGNDIFHIFNDEKDDEMSGGEQEAMNDSVCNPSTVREKLDEDNPAEDQMHNSMVHAVTVDKESSTKSSENVTNAIESSIYCAKVKDLRVKIDEQMLSILTWLERRDILNAEVDDVLRMRKRAAEFSNRFNRIYIYQLQRQMHDVNRHNRNTLPFAKHTHFQSQMVRIVSLHQNMYQAYQVFFKSLDQTSCLCESADCLRSLIQASRDAMEVCRGAPTPKDFASAANLYSDSVLLSCDKLEKVINEYSTRVEELLNTGDSNSNTASRKSKSSGRKKAIRKWKNASKKSGTDTEGRLSMYSLDTLRLNLNGKSTSSKDNHSSGASKTRVNMSSVYSIQKKDAEKNVQGPKSNRKSPRYRRPLMRDPHAGKPRAPRQSKDTDIQTMVEAVETCPSSHISREVSPRVTPTCKDLTPRKHSEEVSPKMKLIESTPRKTHIRSPHQRLRVKSPLKSKARYTSPVKKAFSSVRNNINDAELSQYAKRETVKSPKETPKVENIESAEPSPRLQEVAVGTVEVEKGNVREKKLLNTSPDRCEVTRILKQLCSTDASGSKNERLTGAKNAQLFCMNGGISPRSPSTPQLLKILEETIRKKPPKSLFQKPSASSDTDKYRLQFNIPEKTSESLYQYRKKFVQHMLSSPMYANSAVGRPWEMIGSISEKIIDELLLGCAKELELRNVIEDLYRQETK